MVGICRLLAKHNSSYPVDKHFVPEKVSETTTAWSFQEPPAMRNQLTVKIQHFRQTLIHLHILHNHTTAKLKIPLA